MHWGKTRKLLTIIAAAAVLGAGGGVGRAQAADSSSGEASGDGSVFTLGEIEVAGQTEPATASTIRKITEEEMRQFNRDNVATAANLIPGVAITRFGARNETMVSIRGFDIKHVPIYQDGIPIYVPYDGYPDLSRFETFDLSQIVVSKGFTSVLYGPNTMGGAINLVSKRPTKEFEATGGGGMSTNDGHVYLNLGTNQGLWYLQASGSYLDSDGFYLADGFPVTRNEDGDLRNNSYHTDEKGSIKIGLTPNDTDEYALTYSNQHGEKGTPPYAGTNPGVAVRYWKWPYWDKESLYFNSTTQPLEQFYVKTRVFYDMFRNSLYSYDSDSYSSFNRPYAFRSKYDDHTVGGSTELGTTVIPDNTTKLAFHYKEDYHTELGNVGQPWQHFEEGIYSIGLEDTWKMFERFSVVGGVSYDHIQTVQAEDYQNGKITDFANQGDADAWNPQIGLFYEVIDDGVARFTVARKSRLPTIKDKFSYRLGTAIPNPDLEPEYSTNYELGYKQELLDKKLTLDGAVYYYDISDFIYQKSVPNPSNPSTYIYQNQNIASVEQYGFEAGASVKDMAGFFGGINYTLLEYKNNSTSDPLTGVPRHKIFSFLGYEFLPGLTAQTDVEYDSDRLSSTPVRRSEGFTLVGAKLSYAFAEHYTVEAGVENLLDKDYAIDEGFPEPGRTFFGGMRFSF